MSIFFRRKKNIEKQDDLQTKKSENVKIKKTKFAYQNLVRPIMTEKVSGLGTQNQYVFEVESRTNKVEIKKAIQNIYNVKVQKVNIINICGRTVRYGRNYGRTKNWKKAIVILEAGEKIGIYEGV